MRKHALAIRDAVIFLVVAGVTLSFAHGLLTTGWDDQLVSEYAAKIRQKDYTQTSRGPAQRSCVILPFLDQKACLETAANAARENEREDRDLIAQEVTAVWTRITAYAAIGGIVASIAGLGLIFIAYREARKTNDITREVGEAQTRAWVSVKLSVTQQINSSDGPFEIAMEMACICTNHGPSPALHLKFFVDVAYLRSSGRNAIQVMDDYCDLCRPHQGAGVALFSGDPIILRDTVRLEARHVSDAIAMHQMAEPHGGIVIALFIGCVNYEIAGSNKIHQTKFIFEVTDTVWDSPITLYPPSEDWINTIFAASKDGTVIAD